MSVGHPHCGHPSLMRATLQFRSPPGAAVTHSSDATLCRVARILYQIQNGSVLYQILYQVPATKRSTDQYSVGRSGTGPTDQQILAIVQCSRTAPVHRVSLTKGSLFGVAGRFCGLKVG